MALAGDVQSLVLMSLTIHERERRDSKSHPPTGQWPKETARKYIQKPPLKTLVPLTTGHETLPPLTTDH